MSILNDWMKENGETYATPGYRRVEEVRHALDRLMANADVIMLEDS